MLYPTGNPGGISNGLHVWLKANVDITKDASNRVSQWSDQSMEDNDAIQANTSAQPIFVETYQNYNPAINLDGSDRLQLPNTIIGTGNTSYSIFSIATKSDATNDNPIIGIGQSISPSTPDQIVHEYDATQFEASWANSGLFGGLVQENNQSLGLFTSTYDPANNPTRSLYQLGTQVASTPGTNLSLNPSENYIGSRNVPSAPGGYLWYTGFINEAIVFDRALSLSERNKVESYLAIKYGMTLDNTAGGAFGDYLLSDNILAWDASENSSYHNDVIGICEDSDSGLSQKQSKEHDDGLILYIDALVANNAANMGSITNDFSTIMVGNDAGSYYAEPSNASYLEKPAAIESRFDREWKITNTNFADDYSLQFNWEGDELNFDIADVRLLIDDDGDFTDATILADGAGISIVQGSIIISGIGTAEIPLNATRYVTIASVDLMQTSLEFPVFTPGGVVNNLQIWLKADDNGGVNNDGQIVNTWENKVGDDDFNIFSGDPTFKNDAANLLNFNPVIDFDGNDFYINTATDYNLTGAVAHIFGVSASFNSESPHQGRHPFIGANNGITGALEFNMLESTDKMEFGQYNIAPLVSQSIDRNRPGLFSAWRDMSGVSHFSDQGLQTIHTTTTSSFVSSNYYIGASHNVGIFNGTIPEILVYNRALLATELRRVESYLAIKYGFTLDNSAGGSFGDYRLSDNSLVWDASLNGSYHHEVIGICKDYESNISQKQSKDHNDDLLIYMNALAATNAANTGNITNNLASIIIGNDAGSYYAEPANASYLEKPTGIESRFDREWKITNTNFADDYSIQFNWEGDEMNFAITDIRLLIDDDGDFSDATVLADGADISIAQGSIIVSGIGTAEIPLNTTRYITIASVDNASTSLEKVYPGDVSNNLQLWLKADAGVISDASNKVSMWRDQSGNNYDVDQSDISRQPVKEVYDFCNLSKINFDGQGDFLNHTVDNVLSSGSARTIFVYGELDQKFY